MITRRGLLGALAAMAAPAIVSPKIIMPIRPRIIVPSDSIVLTSDLSGPSMGDFTMEAWVRRVPSDWFTHTMVSLDGVVRHYIDYKLVDDNDPRIQFLRASEPNMQIDNVRVFK